MQRNTHALKHVKILHTTSNFHYFIFCIMHLLTHTSVNLVTLFSYDISHKYTDLPVYCCLKKQIATKSFRSRRAYNVSMFDRRWYWQRIRAIYVHTCRRWKYMHITALIGYESWNNVYLVCRSCTFIKAVSIFGNLFNKYSNWYLIIITFIDEICEIRLWIKIKGDWRPIKSIYACKSSIRNQETAVHVIPGHRWSLFTG